jgi:DNA-binding transcriptional LysR family regulator
MVGMSYSSALQQYLGHQAGRLGRQPKLRVRVNNFDAMGRMVEKGVGISVMPETAAMRCRTTMAISIVRLSDDWALRQLILCFRRFDDLPIHAQRLIEHLTQPAAAA